MAKSVTADDRPAVKLTDPEINPDHLIMEGIAVDEPWFSVGEVGRFFFARSPHWIRWREKKGFFSLSGQKVGTSRVRDGHMVDSTKSKLPVATNGETPFPGQRRYNLADIEKIAYALAEKGAIDPTQLRLAIRLVGMQARLWEYID